MFSQHFRRDLRCESIWEEEGELQEMDLSRKSFAFNADNPDEMNQKREVFEDVMKTDDVCDLSESPYQRRFHTLM